MTSKTQRSRSRTVLTMLVSVCSLLAGVSTVFAQEHQASPEVLLTSEERAWLDAHSEIRIGLPEGLEPYVMANPLGEQEGILVDFKDELNRVLGANLILKTMPSSMILEMSRDREIDIIYAVEPDTAEQLGLLQTKVWATGYPAIYARQNDPVKTPDDMVGKRVVVRPNTRWDDTILQFYSGQVQVAHAETPLAAMNMILSGEADMYLGLTSHGYVIAKYRLFGVSQKYVFTDVDVPFVMGIRPDWSPLVPILNKGVTAIGKDGLTAIVAKWIAGPVAEQSVELTAEEREWIRAHPVVRLGIDQSWEPFVYVEDGKAVRGFDVEFLETISGLIGTRIELVPGRWADLVEQAKRRELDGLAQSAASEERAEWFRFSDTYTSHYYVLATTSDNTASIRSPTDLVGRRVAVQLGNVWLRKLVESIGDIRLVEATSQEDAFGLVVAGKADAACVGAEVARRMAMYHHEYGAKVVHVFSDRRLDVVYSIRKDWPQLAPILNKALRVIPEQEKDRLLRKYMLEVPTVEGPRLDLTEAERTWLEAHSNITLGYADSLEPEVIVDADGALRGMLVDFLDELNRRLGTRIVLEARPIANVFERMQEAEIDGIPHLHPGYADELGLLKTTPYWRLYPAVFTRQDTPFRGPADLADKKIAIIDRLFFTEELLQEHGQGASVVRVPDALTGLQLVGKGEADAFIGATFTDYLVGKYQLFGIVSKYVFLDCPDKLCMGIRADWPELVAILNKGLASFSEEEIDAIAAKWGHPQGIEPVIAFTPEERAWLAENHTVRVRVTAFPPFMFPGEGKPTGISIDYLRLVAERTGIRLAFEDQGRPFADAVERMRRLASPDLIPCMERTPEREADISFSRNYYSAPRVIYVRAGAMDIQRIEDLAGKTIATVRATALTEQIGAQFPDVDLQLHDSDAQCLEALSREEADAYIGNLTLASYIILERGLTNLKVAAPSPFEDHRFAFGSRKDWPQLSRIIDKGLDTISADERAAIRNKYLSLRYEHGIRPIDVLKWVLGIGAAAACIVFLLGFWNRSLKRQVQERTADLQYHATLFSSVFYAQSIPMAILNTVSGERVDFNDSYVELSGYSREELQADTLFSLVIWDDPEEQKRALAKLIKDRCVRDYPARITTKSGEVRELIGSAVMLEVGERNLAITAWLDVTAEKQAQRTVEESESRFRATFEQAAVGIAHISAEGRFLRVNQRFCAITGYTREEMLELTFQDITYPDDLEADVEQSADLLRGETDTYTTEKRYIRASGGTVWVSLTVSLVRDEAGEPRWFVSVVMDITKRREAEAQVEADQRRLRALASELVFTEERERRRIATDLHDGAAQSLALARIQLADASEAIAGMAPTAELDDASRTVRESLQQIRNVLLDLSSPSLAEIGLPEALSEWLTERVGRGHNLRTAFTNECGDVPLADDVRLMLFRNARELLANVVKHGEATRVLVSMTCAQQMLRVTVEDDGVGFDPESRAAMPSGEGGFGLFSIREHMADLGGSLEIVSAPGKGCRATLIMPIAGVEEGAENEGQDSSCG